MWKGTGCQGHVKLEPSPKIVDEKPTWLHDAGTSSLFCALPTDSHYNYGYASQDFYNDFEDLWLTEPLDAIYGMQRSRSAVMGARSPGN